MLRTSDDGGSAWRTAAAFALFGAVLLANILVADAAVLTGLTVVGPLSAGLVASRRATLVMSGLALAAAGAATLWNHSFPDWRYWVPLSAVSCTCAFALVTSDYRRRVRVEAARMRALAQLAVIARPGSGLPELGEAICGLLVPSLFDLCVVDHYDAAGHAQHLAGASSGDPQGLRAWLARPPDGLGHGSSGESPRAEHLPRIDATTMGSMARDEEQLEILRRLNLTSSLSIPLIARERPVGKVTLATRPGRPEIVAPRDVGFAETLAGRIGLVLENTILSGELSTSERERDVILANLDAGVTVRNRRGEMVYANEAAARMLRLPNPAALIGLSAGSLMSRFDVFTEEGERVDLADLPGIRILRGELNPEPLTVRNIVRETGEERWLLNKATPVLDPHGEVLLSIDVTEDITQTKRSEVAQRLLAGVALNLAGAVDVDAALQLVAEAAVPGLADWAGVDLREANGGIRTVAIAHRDPDKVRLGWKLRTRWPVTAQDAEGIAAVIATGESDLVPDIPDALLAQAALDPEHLETLRGIGLNSTMITPIRSGGTILGALSFVSSTSRRFDAEDLALAAALGQQIGVLIESAQISAEQAHIARTLQAGLVPGELPPIPGWAVSTAYRAAGVANEVGGDFYDVVGFDGGWAAIIGDVMGKGATAAALTATARHTLASVIAATGDAVLALSVLNRRLRDPADGRLGLTTAAIVMIHRSGRTSILSAGHPLPLLRRGQTVVPVGQTSPILGFVAELNAPETWIDTAPGDQLVLYTDGILDAEGTSERFGETRLHDAVAGLSAADPSRHADALLAAIDRFVAAEATDDVAVLTLTRQSAPLPLPAAPRRLA